ncbi:MAG: ComEA family DNA-binding protein [Gammaproteobacteria bacterium]
MDCIRKILLTSFLFFSLQLAAADRINVNTADAETLMSIQGVGEKRAEAIIDYREENGPFSSVEELMNVDGVGQMTLDNNRDMLTAE